MSAAKRNRDLLAEHFGVTITNKFQHVPHALRRSVMQDLEKEFEEEFRRTASAQFRSSDDISVASSLGHYYGYITGRAVPGSLRYFYADIAREDTPDRLTTLLRDRDYDVFCLNDHDSSRIDPEHAGQDRPRLPGGLLPDAELLREAGDRAVTPQATRNLGDPLRSSPKLTVIVPFYNVAEYLGECLASVARQDAFDRCQVVLVDDGSRDGSGDIAAEFSLRHANVEVITQANTGPGTARNAGIDRAVGSYLMFVDSDDVLPDGAISHLLSLMAPDVDVAVGRMETFPASTTWPWLRALEGGDRVLRSLGEAPELVHGAGPCNKVFRREFVNRIGLRFAGGGHFEDVQFVVPALALSRGIAVTDHLVYLYRKRWDGGSIMDAVFTRLDNFEDHLAGVEVLADLVPQLDGACCACGADLHGAQHAGLPLAGTRCPSAGCAHRLPCSGPSGVPRHAAGRGSGWDA